MQDAHAVHRCTALNCTVLKAFEGEYLGIISKIVRSSTNLALGAQEETRSLTMTAKSSGPSFVPCGIFPFRHLMDDACEDPQKVENCVLPSKKTGTF